MEINEPQRLFSRAENFGIENSPEKKNEGRLGMSFVAKNECMNGGGGFFNNPLPTPLVKNVQPKIVNKMGVEKNILHPMFFVWCFQESQPKMCGFNHSLTKCGFKSDAWKTMFFAFLAGCPFQSWTWSLFSWKPPKPYWLPSIQGRSDFLCKSKNIWTNIGRRWM